MEARVAPEVRFKALVEVRGAIDSDDERNEDKDDDLDDDDEQKRRIGCARSCAVTARASPPAPRAVRSDGALGPTQTSRMKTINSAQS